MKNQIYKKSIGILSQVLSNPWLARVKSGKGLIGPLLAFSTLIVGPHVGSLPGAVSRYAWTCHNLIKSQGVAGLSKWMKACSVLLMQSLSGEPHLSTRPVGPAVARTRGRKLPRVIPVGHRRMIVRGSRWVIRLWLSLFSLYRVLDWKGKVNLATIEAKGVPTPISFVISLSKFVPIFFKYRSMFKRSPTTLVACIRPSLTTGPNSLNGWPSAFSSLFDAATWLKHPLYATLVSYCFVTGQMGFLYPIEYLGTQMWKPRVPGERMVKEVRHVSVKPRLISPNSKGERVEIRTSQGGGWDIITFYAKGTRLSSVTESMFGGTDEPKGLALGKLGKKFEPGKVRLFAIVDYWTQCLMQPVHDWAFDILRGIPQDGTFDQLKPLKRLVNRMERSGIRRSWSYDLSAATDRFPLWVQRSLLSGIFSDRFGTLWARLLAGRKYAHRSKGVIVNSSVYATGQPMGALSSWGVFSLSHHLVVQFCAWRVGYKRWFDLYALLGDDIVIADEKVAKEYVTVMEALGVKIGLAKSLVGANRSLEFAKRFILEGVDVSPISLKEYHVAKSHIPSLNELIPKVQSLVDLRLCHVLRGLGFGYKAVSRLSAKYVRLSKRMSQAVLMLTAPAAPFGYTDGLNWFQSVGYGLVQPWSADERQGLLHSLASKGVNSLFTRIQMIAYRMEFSGTVPDSIPDPLTGRLTPDPLPPLEKGGKRTSFQLFSEADAVGPWSLGSIVKDWRDLVERPCFEWIERSLVETKKLSAALRQTCRALLQPGEKGSLLTTYLEQTRSLERDLARYPQDITLLFRPGVQSELQRGTRDLRTWKSLKRNYKNAFPVVRVATTVRTSRKWT
jgi:hypothetical protein